MSTDDAITASVVVALPPTAAFEVFTEEVDVWWRRGPEYRVGAETSSELSFEPGLGGRLLESVGGHGEPLELGRIDVWEPGRRLALDWRGPNFEPGQTTRVEIRFEPVGEGTRVTVAHSGWASLPPDHPVRHGLPDDDVYRMWGSWWRNQLAGLRTTTRSSRPRRDRR